MMNTSSNGPWIPICCDRGELYPFQSFCYENDSFTSDKMIFPKIVDSNLVISNISLNDFFPRYGLPCEVSERRRYSMEFQDVLGMMMFENGTIYLKNYLAWEIDGMKYLLDTKDYCFSYNATFDERALEFCDTLADVYRDILRNEATRHDVASIITGLMLPFLIATFIIYTILPELRNLHGSILRVYIACRLLAHTIHFLQFASVFRCVYALGIISHFSFLAAPFWLNVMCFDIWWTFRKYKPLQHSRQLNGKKFLVYSIYAWGCPALIVGVGAITDNLPTGYQGIIRPGFHSACWFDGLLALVIYFDAPIVLTFISNVYFFVSTSISMIRHRNRMAQQFQDSSDNSWRTAETQRFKLCLKLFIVMGIIRLCHLLVVRLLEKPSVCVWIFIKFPATFESLAIFIIFVWKDKIKRLLLQRLGWSDKSFC